MEAGCGTAASSCEPTSQEQTQLRSTSYAIKQPWRDLQDFMYGRECERIFKYWNRKRHANSDLSQTHEGVFVWEPALDGASTDALRAWFKAKRSGLPEGARRDCFLVADEDVLANESILSAGEGTWSRSPQERDSLTLRAVDPDHDATKAPRTMDYGYDSAREPITEADLEGFAGGVRVPVHKVFDWLYYTLAKDTESWEDRHKQTTQGKAKAVMPYWPYQSTRR